MAPNELEIKVLWVLPVHAFHCNIFLVESKPQGETTTNSSMDWQSSRRGRSLAPFVISIFHHTVTGKLYGYF